MAEPNDSDVDRRVFIKQAMASAAGGFQPAGYYPYYWYGK